MEQNNHGWFERNPGCFVTVRGMQLRVMNSGPVVTRAKLVLPDGTTVLGYTPRVNVGQ